MGDIQSQSSWSKILFIYFATGLFLFSSLYFCCNFVSILSFFFFYIVNYSLTTYQLQCAMHRVFALACIIIQKNWIPWKANKVRKVKSLSLLYTIIKKKKKLEQILAFTMETKHVAYSNLSPFNIPNQMTAGRIWMKIILFSVYQRRLVLIQYK